MSSTNFLQFDSQQTNMLSDENYSSDTERSSGFVTGISRSILFNKTLFQSSTMSTALANVLVNRGFDAMDNNLSSLEESIEKAFPKSDGLPIGSLFPTTCPITTAPEGFLLPNGAPFNPTTYPELAEAYRTGTDTYKYGQVYLNGIWYPLTPDLRGYFLRVHNSQVDINYPGGGSSANLNPDYGRTLGSTQGDAIRNLTGKIDGSGNATTSEVLGEIHTAVIDGVFEGIYGKQMPTADGSGSSTMLRGFKFDASKQVPVAEENRPVNVALTYLIVAKNKVNLEGLGFSLARCSDVDLNNLSNGQVLIYNSSTQKWENNTVSMRTTYRGTYDVSTAYLEGDIVKYGGFFYEAKQNTVAGTAPNNTTYWSQTSDSKDVFYTEVSDDVERPIASVASNASGSNYTGPVYFTTQNSPTINASTGILTAPGLKSTTQSQGDNSTNVATTEYVDTAVAGAGSQPTYNSSTKTLEF